MPREIPTEAQISKLPKWAQDHIKHLQRDRETAVEQLLEFRDAQTETGVYTQALVCIGEGMHGSEPDPAKKGGPTFLRHYLQTQRVYFRLPRADMDMEVYVNEEEQRVEIRTPTGFPLIEPAGGNLFYLVPKEDMYLTPNAVTLCQAAVEAPTLSQNAFERKFGFRQETLPEKMRQVVPKSHWRRTVSG